MKNDKGKDRGRILNIKYSRIEPEEPGLPKEILGDVVDINDLTIIGV